MKNKSQKQNTVEKTIAILKSFIPYNQGIGTLELSKQLGFNKSTTSRLLHILTKTKFLRQDPNTKKFTLSQLALDLGRAVVRSINTNIVQLAKPHIDQLRLTLNETCGLELISGNHLILAYTAPGSQRIRFTPSIGEKLPIHASAGSKAVLAYLPPQFVKKLLKSEGVFSPLTPNTIRDPKVLMRQLREISNKGFAFDCEEVDTGINAIGVPIFNYENEPVGALVVAGPASRIQADDNSSIIPLMKETASEISDSLFRIND